MSSQNKHDLEIENVSDVYSQIAQHFSDTRVHQWPWITNFIQETNHEGTKVLDIGCGNGRNMDGYTNATVMGIDECKEFVEICLKRGKDVCQGDMCNLPYNDNSFDTLLSIASFHHLATEARRVKALQEMRRVIKPGGKVLLSVWSKNQPSKAKQKFTKYGDTIVKWNKFGMTYDRYYYIFRIDELKRLFSSCGWHIEKHFWDYGNEIFILY